MSWICHPRHNADPSQKCSLITINHTFDVTGAIRSTAPIDQSGWFPKGCDLTVQNKTFFQLLTDL